ncbi:MAG TPA: trypsin-like peptidase domain-containing protein [Thermoanaerobaculia bacterium]
MSNVLTQISDAVSSILGAVAPSVLRIDGARRSSASGIAWSEDLVVTASHVIRRGEGITVARDDGESFPGTIVGGDGGTDVALLRVNAAALRPIGWSERTARAGDFVLVAGRPGRSVRVSSGIVTVAGGEWRSHDGSLIDRYVDVDASLPRGFSGGPLLDSEGACIGMNTSRVAPGGATIPRATLQRVVDELLQHGSVRRPLIGVGVYPVEDGLLVMSVKDDSGAARAGILVGDIIRSIDETEVRSPRALHALLQSVAIGREVEIALTRGGEARTVRLAVGTA